jgi:4-amino-4-deoxy-L-arabinose transferase-like glycosyltransferase
MTGSSSSTLTSSPRSNSEPCQSRARRTFHLLIVFTLASIILFSHLSEGGLDGYDDAFYAHEGKQMLITGDWWNVRFNGALNFEYPPMFIWLEALSMKVLGVSDFAAKFPSALSALLIILLVFFLAREMGGEFLPSICASWIMMLSQYFMKWAMHAMTDAPFTLFFTLSLYFYVKGLKRPNYLILCGPAIGAAIMTRSVIGFIPVGIIISHLIITGQRQRLLSIRLSGRLLSGLLIGLSLPSVWYFSQYLSHGEQFLSAHTSFIGGKIFLDGNSEDRGFGFGLLEYPRLLLRFYWPWAPLMIIGLVTQARLAISRGESPAVLLTVWVSLVVAPFSLAEAKVLRYIMPAFPAFSILAAIPAARLISATRLKAHFRTAYVALTAAVLLIACFPNPLERAEDMIKLAPVVNSRTDPSQKVTIYTSHPGYISQFLWYSNRLCERLAAPDKLSEALQAQGERVFIIGVDDYKKLVINSAVNVEVIMVTKNLVCFKTIATHVTLGRREGFSNLATLRRRSLGGS